MLQTNGFVAKSFASRSPFWCNHASFRNGGWLEDSTPAALFSTLENISMKKTLIALAAVAATSAAFAQSSVTLYGVADLGVGDSNAAGSEIRMNGNALMNNGSSRLGVRGVEDLGGGLKAAFNFEQGINPLTGATDVFNVAGATPGSIVMTPTTFQRAANISLSGAFGAVKLGRTLTPSFFGVAAWELTSTANYSVVGNQFGYAGSGSRNNAVLSYSTPNIAGFTATLGTVLEGNTGANATQGTAAKYDINVIYRGGPLTAALSYNQVQDDGAKGLAVGGKYDFGGFAVAASYHDSERANGVFNAEGYTIGAAMKLGPVSLVVDIARDTEAKDTDVLLEAKYPLSKRTTAYAAFLRNGDGKQATSVNNYGVGIRHNF
jgi:predicted porin